MNPVPTSSERAPRLVRMLVTLAAASAMLLMALIVGAGPASAAVPAMTATQTSGLAAAGQTVTVNGNGFSANTGLFLAVCDPAVPAGGACDLGNFKQVTTDAKGGFSSAIKIVAKFNKTDCTKVKCVLETNEPANPTSTANVATLAISFKTAAPATSKAPAPAKSDPATAAPQLPRGTDAGKADTGSQLTVATVVLVLALGLFGTAGVLYVRRRSARN